MQQAMLIKFNIQAWQHAMGTFACSFDCCHVAPLIHDNHEVSEPVYACSFAQMALHYSYHTPRSYTHAHVG